MDKFRPPFRIRVVFENAGQRPELKKCKITMEELSLSVEPFPFPEVDYDTARVFFRYKGYEINVAGRLNGGTFEYMINAYQPDGSPWAVQGFRPIHEVEQIIEFVIGKFDLIA
jgi:hypothetical protein